MWYCYSCIGIWLTLAQRHGPAINRPANVCPARDCCLRYETCGPDTEIQFVWPCHDNTTRKGGWLEKVCMPVMAANTMCKLSSRCNTHNSLILAPRGCTGSSSAVVLIYLASSHETYIRLFRASDWENQQWGGKWGSMDFNETVNINFY